jgi:DNA (cytosine-5)-methyltransferase 1
MNVYYNDNEPYAAQWLRNLIGAGHLPRGDVDDRSILDVGAADVGGYAQCHFFAGLGGWPYALRLARWPADRPVWTASCPCQPLSSAGARREHADRRHLWPALYRLVAECRPPVLFGEQVASKAGREWLAAVRADLEHLGYAVGAADLPAASVGAPHIRQRLWFVADADRGGEHGLPVHAEMAAPSKPFPDADSAELRQQPGRGDGPGRPGAAFARDDGPAASLADANKHAGNQGGSRDTKESSGGGNLGGNGSGKDVADAALQRRDGRREAARPGAEDHRGWAVESGMGGGSHGLSAGMVGCGAAKDAMPAAWANGWEDGIPRVAAGVASRVGQLRAYGNAIVPQVGAEFIEAYLELGR